MSSSGLNMALIDLRDERVRDRALPDLAAYLADYDLTGEERDAILAADWVTMFRCGASSYAMNKLRHIRRLVQPELGPTWRACTGGEFDQFLAAQQTANDAYRLPVELS